MHFQFEIKQIISIKISQSKNRNYIISVTIYLCITQSQSQSQTLFTNKINVKQHRMHKIKILIDNIFYKKSDLFLI